MLTQRFPFLLPLRLAQKKVFFYTGMRFDGQTYAKTRREDMLPYLLYSAENGLYNVNTGFDMLYQENKAFNLRLAAKSLNGLLIRPGETFSFWQTVRYADRHTAYKDGLAVVNGKLTTVAGGGLCQMSNLLFWVFLHSPLTILERHTHRVKDFPTLRNTEPEGVDATISEGWLDLKMKNETDTTYQIGLDFDDRSFSISLFSDAQLPLLYEIEGKDLRYFRKNDKLYQQISIYRRELRPDTGVPISEELLYTNVCTIGYQLPDDTTICDEGGFGYDET